MTQLELFKIIDDAIEVFIKNEGVKHSFKVENKKADGWLVYSWRQLRWTVGDLDYFIEVTPNFDRNDKIVSWTLITAVFYDSGNKRFYLSKMMANKKTLKFIAANIGSLLLLSYSIILGVSKDEIPFAVELNNKGSILDLQKE